MDRPRRAPAVERRVEDISEDNIRIRVLGEVESVEEDCFLLTDGKSKIKVETNESPNEGDLVRVFGRPVKTEKGVEISSEFTQNMNGLNRNLYKTIISLSKRDNYE